MSKPSFFYRISAGIVIALLGIFAGAFLLELMAGDNPPQMLIPIVMGFGMITAVLAVHHHQLNKLREEAGGDPVLLERIADLEDQLAAIQQRALTSGEVEQAYVRLAEMEERVDFAERLLTQRAEVLPLPPLGGMQ